MTNYFDLLNLTLAFDLDIAVLESAYFKAQREYHPDRFVGKPPALRQQAMQQSITVNNAYHTLREPLTRAQYLLQLQGIRVGTEQDSIKPSQSLLMETLEWREQIDEAQNENTLNKLDNLLGLFYKQSIDAIGNFYQKASWEAMAQETLRLGYIIKAQDALRQRRK